MDGRFTGFHSVAVGALGISNDSHVVVYDRSDSGIFSSPRVWWTFRYFGHDNVSVLNGGWQHWLKEGFPVDSSTEFAHPRVPPRDAIDFPHTLTSSKTDGHVPRP